METDLRMGDCLEALPTLVGVDAVITDPPYGIEWMPRVNNQVKMLGDDRPFDPAPFLNVGKARLFWGANYFSSKLPDMSSWFIWLKQPNTFDNCHKSYAPCELAWSDIGGRPRIKHHTWDGNFRKGMDSGTSFHPAQKPTEVMMWCITELTNPGDTVLDPFMGSGTTGVACAKLGRKFIGIERDEGYFKIAQRRIEQAQAQLSLDLFGAERIA